MYQKKERATYIEKYANCKIRINLSSREFKRFECSLQGNQHFCKKKLELLLYDYKRSCYTLFTVSSSSFRTFISPGRVMTEQMKQMEKSSIRWLDILCRRAVISARSELSMSNLEETGFFTTLAMTQYMFGSLQENRTKKKD